MTVTMKMMVILILAIILNLNQDFDRELISHLNIIFNKSNSDINLETQLSSTLPHILILAFRYSKTDGGLGSEFYLDTLTIKFSQNLTLILFIFTNNDSDWLTFHLNLALIFFLIL